LSSKQKSLEIWYITNEKGEIIASCLDKFWARQITLALIAKDRKEKTRFAFTDNPEALRKN